MKSFKQEHAVPLHFRKSSGYSVEMQWSHGIKEGEPSEFLCISLINHWYPPYSTDMRT